jgi:hypothetical protein
MVVYYVTEEVVDCLCAFLDAPPGAKVGASGIDTILAGGSDLSLYAPL